jgi:hypothetical protein
MSSHAYPTSALVGDYARSAAGFVPSALILALTPLGTVAAIVVGAFAALFAAFGIRTALRHNTRLELNEEGIAAAGPLAVLIRWDSLDRLKLAYYSTRRDSREGWMQLELRSGWRTLRLDSRIDGFREVVGYAARAAIARDLPLSDATRANLAALGITPPAGGER